MQQIAVKNFEKKLITEARNTWREQKFKQKTGAKNQEEKLSQTTVLQEGSISSLSAQYGRLKVETTKESRSFAETKEPQTSVSGGKQGKLKQ